jgi:hypothetical protein
VRLARLADGFPDDEVFTSSTGALQGGGRARWGDGILTTTVGRRRGGGGFDGGVLVTAAVGGRCFRYFVIYGVYQLRTLYKIFVINNILCTTCIY